MECTGLNNTAVKTKSLRYLWVYSAADEWAVNWHDRLLGRRRERGYDIEGFCNTPLELNRRWLPFPELDRRWRNGDKALMTLYERLAKYLEGREVLILYNGANLHPEFVRQLGCLKVYTAGDDPESTEILTKPIAPAFDIHLVNNIACLGMYRSWGLKHVHFWPLGSLTTIDDVSDINATNILDMSKRSVPIVFFGGNQQHRKERFDRISQSFPQAFCAGSGWPRGFLSWGEMWNIYRQTQIGWNFHNSTGPINFRTYELPAYGIMQICDNKANLGKIFELDKEVVGFNSIDECIALTRHYLEQPDEQRAIAVAGWKRWRKDYHPDRVWERLVEIVETHWQERFQAEPNNSTVVLQSLRRHKRWTLPLRVVNVFLKNAIYIFNTLWGRIRNSE